MKRVLLLLLSAVILLSGCTGVTSAALIEMELTEDYDTSDPFVHAKLFYVEKDIDHLDLDISFQMEGERGILEIADNESKQVIWSDTWDGNVDETKFTVSLDTAIKEKEYVIQFTGTKIKYAKIVMTSENKLVKERAKPLKPDTACSNGDSSLNSTFSSIDDAKIPDALDITVGTLEYYYFSDGITDNPDYNSVLTATFKDTTDADYTKLLEFYKSTSTGTDENGSLIFDWGTLLVTTKDSSISITALIK